MSAVKSASLLSLSFALALSAGARSGSASEPTVPPGPDSARSFKLTYRTLVPKPAEGSKTVEVWVPLPIESQLQQVRDLAITAPIPYEVTVEPVNGNRMVHVLVNDPKQDTSITWSAVVIRNIDAGQETGVANPTHLAGNRLAPVDDAAMAALKAIPVDPALPTAEKARRIFDHVVAVTEYSKDDKIAPGWGTADFARVCRLNNGNCSDFTARFVTLARAAGIPARWSSSIALSEEHAACDACGYHCFAHYLLNGLWVPVDPSDSKRALPKDPAKAEWLYGHAARSNVVLSQGRDVVLAPAQKGPPVNFLAGPYVEVDGKPISLTGKNRSYEYVLLNADGTPAVEAAKPAEAPKTATPTPAAK